MKGDERTSDGEHAVVHALLAERLGFEVAPDLTDTVLSRVAAGEAAAASAKLEAAEGLGDGAGPKLARWLAAALVLLGLGVVVAVGVSQLGDRGGASATIPEPQDPQAEPEFLDVRDFDHLRRVLSEAVGLTIELRDLPLCEVELPVPMSPYHVTAKATVAIADSIVRDVRELPHRANRRKWDARLRFTLREGKLVEMLFISDDVLERENRVRCAIRGMPHGASVGKLDKNASEQDRDLVESAFTEALQSLKVANGVVSSLMPEPLEPFLACESVILVPHPLFSSLGGIRTRDLANLAKLTRLRRLDVSYIAKEIDLWAADHIAKVEWLEELVLDRCTLDASDIEPLGDMPKLRSLSLRRCPFEEQEAMGRLFAGAELAPPFSVLEWLDMSENALTESQLRGLAARHTFRHLVLERCGLDDEDLAILAAAKSPVESLGLRGNQGLSRQGLDALCAGLPTLRFVDARGCGLSADADEVELGEGTRVRLR